MTRIPFPTVGTSAARALLIGLAALAIPGCQPGDETPEPDTAAVLDEMQPPTFEQLMARAEVLEDGRLVIDHDIAVADVAAARAYYDQQVALLRQRQARSGNGTSRQPLTVNVANGVDTLWGIPQRMDLTYCVDTASFGANANLLVSTLEEAGYLWSRRVGVQFRRVQTATCNNTTTAVVFNVRQASISGNAMAFFPNEGRATRELLVNPVSFTTTSGGRDLLGILSHELGHAIGMRHEHMWIDCTGEAPENDARLVTAYDVNSIMHYPQCRPSGTGGYRQSELDYVGAQLLYGMAPAVLTSIL
jgi:hypothetical protein